MRESDRLSRLDMGEAFSKTVDLGEMAVSNISQLVSGIGRVATGIVSEFKLEVPPKPNTHLIEKQLRADLQISSEEIETTAHYTLDVEKVLWHKRFDGHPAAKVFSVARRLKKIIFNNSPTEIDNSKYSEDIQNNEAFQRHTRNQAVQLAKDMGLNFASASILDGLSQRISTSNFYMNAFKSQENEEN